MGYSLRPYQQAAVDAAIDHMRACTDPAVMELATGAGKSIIVAEIAKWINGKTGKRVLCLAPSKELIEQNREKYLAYGEPASMFSASAGAKCMRHPVVFGSPLTVKNHLDKFDDRFAAVIIDEAHGLTNSVKDILASMVKHNPKLRIIGLTATPYRMNTGYIYGVGIDNRAITEDQTRDPYFKKLIYSLTASDLVGMGYLTPVTTSAPDKNYDTSGLEKASTGKFTAASVESAFEGHGRLTADIVALVVAASIDRKGVMFFASTLQHASEIMASLPSDNARIVDGKTGKKERESIVNDFKAMRFKYLVNVAVFTTGFDAPHVDTIAILRATESAGLFQQIIGRGLRLSDGKIDCLLMDFAENIENHDLQDNIFDPKIETRSLKGEKEELEAVCRVCDGINVFTKRPNPEGFDIDKEGYFVDLAGNRILQEVGTDDSGDTITEPMPAHHGRRCTHEKLIAGSYERCGGRWSYKVCPDCDAENDIAARHCVECKGELVDPNTKLRLEFSKAKQSARAATSDKVLAWRAQEWHSRAGNRSLRVDFTTEYRTFTIWCSPESRSHSGRLQWAELSRACYRGKVAPSIDKFLQYLDKATMPETVTAAKQGDFFKVIAYNQPEDLEP